MHVVCPTGRTFPHVNTPIHGLSRYISCGTRASHPAQWADYRALTGDPADNIPGIRGIGAKTAATLLADGLTLDDLATSGRLESGRGRAVREQFDLALKWRDMIRLNPTWTYPCRAELRMLGTGVESSVPPQGHEA